MNDMNDRSVMKREALDREARVHEERAAENLAVIRRAREQWDSYGQEMTRHARRIEEASVGDDATNYFVQRRVAARRELESYVGHLVREQVELLDETEREISSRSEEEAESLGREKAGVSWD